MKTSLFGKTPFDWANEKGINLEEIIKQCKTEMVDKFIYLVRLDKFEEAKKVLEKSKKTYFGNIIDQLGSQQMTAMYCVAFDNKSEAIKWLVAQGANPSHPISQGYTPLFVAVSQKKDAAIRALLDCGADTSQTIQNLTIFQLAARVGVDLVAILKEVSTIYNALVDEFVLCVRKCNFQRAGEILQRRKDIIDANASNNFNALYCAVCDQNLPAVNWLIEKGVNVNKACVDGITACALAVTQKMQPIIELLIEHKADLTIKDVDGFDCYARAQYVSVDLKAISERVKLKKQHIVHDFVVAVRKNSYSIAEEILRKHPWVIDECDNNQLTALYCCVCDGNITGIEWLLQHGANIEKTVIQNITPLHAAVSKKQPAVVKALLKRGANPTIRDGSGFDAFGRAKVCFYLT